MRLPPGFRVRIHDDVRTLDGGRTLVGGSPLRVVRLTPRAQKLVCNGEIAVNGAASALLADRLLDANIAIPVLRVADRAEAADVTVIVPVMDRIEQLNRALSGLAGLRVIVVDDSSEDACAIANVARRSGAEVVRLDRNVGPAAARNAGLDQVSTPYVAFVDSDVQVTTGTLLSLTAHFADPRVALVAPHLRGCAVNDRPRWFERYEESSPALGLGDRACVVRPGAAVAWLPSACLIGRTDRFVAAGGFDGRMRVGEDVDLVWRLAAAGERVRYDPAHEACHDVRPTLRAWMGRKFVYGTGAAALGDRHPENVMTAILSPAMGLAALALLARRPWSAPVALAGVARGVQVLHRALPPGGDRSSVAVRLSLRGLGWALRQESALVLRHWWPAAFGAALVSRRARRVIVSAMAVDLVVGGCESGWRNPVATFAGRRLDDLAYGAGVWRGALRSGSLQSLKAARTVLPSARRECQSSEVSPPRRDCPDLDDGSGEGA
jgi:mycofactocin system glycosyltransferase